MNKEYAGHMTQTHSLPDNTSLLHSGPLLLASMVDAGVDIVVVHFQLTLHMLFPFFCLSSLSSRGLLLHSFALGLCLRLRGTFCLRFWGTFCLRLRGTFCLRFWGTLCLRLWGSLCLWGAFCICLALWLSTLVLILAN